MHHYLIFASPSWPLPPHKEFGTAREDKNFHAPTKSGENPTLDELEEGDAPFMDDEEALVLPEDEDSDDD